MDKIHGISTPPDLPFCLSSSKTKSSLYERGLKTARIHIKSILTLEVFYIPYPSLPTKSI